MHNCPPAGKWSIAVWEGDSGTAADDALATCGADTVTAAYSLDPQTVAWSRWFAGKPDVSNLTLLNDMQGVLALGSAAAATPTPVSGESGGTEGFRAFAQLIEAALTEQDATFFVERTRLTEVTCTGAEFEPVPCQENPAGTTLSGVLQMGWGSDFSQIHTTAEYSDRLEALFSVGRGDLSDEYGSGSLALYALAHGHQNGEEVFRAITTLIVDTPGGSAGQTQREVHVFDFVFEDGRWGFVWEIAAAGSFQVSQWLGGELGDCYDQYEAWGMEGL
jgi:hypothetical protein